MNEQIPTNNNSPDAAAKNNTSINNKIFKKRELEKALDTYQGNLSPEEEYRKSLLEGQISELEI